MKTKIKRPPTENLFNAKDPVAFAETLIGVNLDPWQREYIRTKGNVAVRAGRQSGKSFAQSLRVALFALLNGKTQTLIIGAVDRQSVELFEKVKSHVMKIAKRMIKGRPTMHKMELTNGSRILALPAGRTGYGLRNYAIHKLVADEAHYIPEEVWVAVRPMLATTGGTMDLLSTPRGNVGFFYEAFQSDDFTTFHTKSEDCPRISKAFLDGERKRMTKLQYMQEYEAEFLDALQAFFPKELVDKCILAQENNSVVSPLFKPGREYCLGIDLAGYGGDENAYVILEVKEGKKTIMKYLHTNERVSAVETVNMIKKLNHTWDFSKIYLDDAGIGTPILDFCKKEDELKRKTEGINNASRSVLHGSNKSKRILKEDLYFTTKLLMEQGRLKILPDEALLRSLYSIQYETDTDTQRVKIHGKYSHITEALIRACWFVHTKGLSIFVDWV